MLREFIELEVRHLVYEKYAYLRRPSAVYALVSSVQKGNVNLRILDKNKVADERYPEIPRVKTPLDVKKGDIVAVLMMYGECIPYIVGRCG